jgi:hypothetical protein
LYPCLSETFNSIIDSFYLNIFLAISHMQKIFNNFTIYFKCRNFYLQFFSKTLILSIDFLLNKNCDSWQNSRKFKRFIVLLIKKHIRIGSFHCKSFSRSCLSICKNASVFTINSSLNKRFNFFKYIILFWIW